MTPTATRSRRLIPRDRRQAAGDALLAAAALVTFVCASLFDRPPTFVPRLHIVNPTVFQVEVDLRAERAGDQWLALGGIRRESTRTTEEILDPGARWLFRFSYGGVEAGQLAITRAELQGAGWSLTIPPEVGERLLAAGLQATAY